ncbi:MAG: hypothetical protein CMA07_02410 [Euryarchaeota archaeon]|nr:hypothetical protein [Euryarchaeota archaeon]
MVNLLKVILNWMDLKTSYTILWRVNKMSERREIRIARKTPETSPELPIIAIGNAPELPSGTELESESGILSEISSESELDELNLEAINNLVNKLGPITKDNSSKKSKKRYTESRFKIWAGIPGTGKSFNLKEELKSLLPSLDYSVRTVFHPEYSNYDFIGQIKPEAIVGTDGNPSGISYPFIEGPFVTALRMAIKEKKDAEGNEPNKVVLVIEELNRGNASAIFGEIFQLLDLDENGISEYGITNRDIARAIGISENHKIQIPENMHIFATMNISDQNVFPLDTAFLRRWDREYVSAENWVSPATDWVIKHNSQVTWYSFATSINNWIVNRAEDLGIEHPEDKRLGPWFLEERHCSSVTLFANKILVYLWTNVFTHSASRDQTFAQSFGSVESLINEFMLNGFNIFNSEIVGNMQFIE